MRDKMSLHLPIIIFGKQCVSLLTLLQFANEDHWLLLLNETWFGLFAHGKSKTPKKCCCFISVLLFFSGNKWKGGSERKTWSQAQPQFVEGLHKPGSSAVRLPLRTISSWASRARPYSPAAVTEWGSPWKRDLLEQGDFLQLRQSLKGPTAESYLQKAPTLRQPVLWKDGQGCPSQRLSEGSKMSELECGRAEECNIEEFDPKSVV